MSELFDVTFARPSALWLLLLLAIIVAAAIIGGRQRRMPRWATMLRAASVALLCVALAEPLWATSSSADTTVFVVDRSRSLDESAGGRIDEWLSEALDAGGDGGRGAVITFGAAPALASPAQPTDRIDVAALSNEAIDRDATNIEAALAMARSLPLGGARRIVLISDGAENSGAALDQASQAASEGLPVDVLPIEGIGDDDLRIEGVSLPSSLWQGEPATVLVSIASGAAGDAIIELELDGAVESSQDVSLQPGLSSYTFHVDDLVPGFHVVNARVRPQTAPDRYPENNEWPSALIVRDAPHLLLVSQAGADSTTIASALESQGIAVETIPPERIPQRLSELSGYDAIMLNNVPATSLTASQLSALQEATRGLGKGLLVLGGTSAYGPGSYAGTTIEELLPVTVKVTEGKERQRVALMLIVDKSGSMAYDPLQTSSKIDMAKEAVRQAADALAEGDEIGILVFNDQQQWIVRLTAIEGPDDREAIHAAVEQISSDGGTEIYPALDIGFDEILKSDADVRHVVLLSDGKSRTGTRESYQLLIDQIRTRNTTLSTIAIGDDADTDLLQFLAEEGHGNYHATERPEDIPRLTLAEAQGAGSQSIIRGSFTPLQTQPSPILRDFEPEELPLLSGYNYAEAKPNAQVVLTSTRDDPVLAKWQYGLGRVIAWTADDGVDFADAWRTWDRYAEFWASALRWSLPDPENGPFLVEVEREGTDALVTVRSAGGIGDYVDFAEAQATIVDGSGATTPDLTFYQSGPGEYQLRIASPDPGAYGLTVEQPGGGDRARSATAGFSIPPALELQPNPDADALLRTIAERTGGRVLSLDEPDAAMNAGFSDAGETLRTYRPVWWLPLGLALALFILDIGLRTQFVQRLIGWRPQSSA